MTIPSQAHKHCNKCGEYKTPSDFYNRSNGKPHSYCKTCYRAKVAARKHGPNRDRVLEMDRKALRLRRKEIRNEAFEAYGGYRCVCCGETEPSFLTLDHINNDGGKFRKDILGRRDAAGIHTYRWLKRNGWPPGLQVMCMNCQHSKRMNGGNCAHGKV